MKKVISIALAAAMATSLVACGGSAASSTAPAASAGGAASTASGDVDYSALDAVELIAGDSTSKGAAGQIFGELVASKVDEITGGQLTIDYHPNGDLGGDADLFQCLAHRPTGFVCQRAIAQYQRARCGGSLSAQVVVAQQAQPHALLFRSAPQSCVRGRVIQLCQQVQAGVQPGKGQFV